MVLSKVGAVAGFTAPVVAFVCMLSAIVIYPQFSWTNNALSDLGVVSGATQWLFNIGLCAAGGLVLIFAVFGLYGFVGKNRFGQGGSAVFAFASVALILIGIFNESFMPIHYAVSVGFFVLVPLALFILTGSFYLNRQHSTALFTVAIGIIAALPWILQFTLNYAPNVAIPETVSALAVSAWTIALSTKILKTSSTERDYSKPAMVK
jgi:hypothetical membrane protein